MNDRGYICPRCGSSRISCFYTAPPQYQCEACGAGLEDENAGPAIPVLTRAEAEAKRPGMYGLPTCEKCSHAPHEEGECRKVCEFCKPPPPHVYKFRVVRG
jgi:hypothetical protein